MGGQAKEATGLRDTFQKSGMGLDSIILLVKPVPVQMFFDPHTHPLVL